MLKRIYSSGYNNDINLILLDEMNIARVEYYFAEMLSPEVSNYIGRGERSDNAVKSIISFVNDIGSEPVADGVFNSHQAEMLYSFECSYCAGNLSGKYMTEKYIKQKAGS